MNKDDKGTTLWTTQTLSTNYFIFYERLSKYSFTVSYVACNCVYVLTYNHKLYAHIHVSMHTHTHSPTCNSILYNVILTAHFLSRKHVGRLGGHNGG